MPKKTTKKPATPITPRPRPAQKEGFWKELNKVIDPELFIGIVDLGLIYEVDMKNDGTAVVIMTLTTPTCPEGPLIIDQVEKTMRAYPGIKNSYAHLVWDPPWTQDLMDPKLKTMLFGD